MQGRDWLWLECLCDFTCVLAIMLCAWLLVHDERLWKDRFWILILVTAVSFIIIRRILVIKLMIDVFRFLRWNSHTIRSLDVNLSITCSWLWGKENLLCSIELVFILVFLRPSFVHDWYVRITRVEMLIHDWCHFLRFVILHYTYSFINLSFDFLLLTSLVNLVPVSWFVCLVRNFLWFLMRFAIVARIENISIIDWKSSRLNLRRSTKWHVLIKLNLLSHVL